MFTYYLNYFRFSDWFVGECSIYLFLPIFPHFCIHSCFDMCPPLIFSLLQSYIWTSKMRSRGQSSVEFSHYYVLFYCLSICFVIMWVNLVLAYLNIKSEHLIPMACLLVVLWVSVIITKISKEGISLKYHCLWVLSPFSYIHNLETHMNKFHSI